MRGAVDIFSQAATQVRSTLELRDGQYFLDGRAVMNGNRLQLMLNGNQGEHWVEGEFFWNGRKVSWPALRFTLGGYASDNDVAHPTAVMSLPPDAVLRWPD